MRLTYWIAECLNDSQAYNIRERTKREAKEELARRQGEYAELGCSGPRYSPVRKVTVEYDDGFDLMWMCLSAGGVSWEDEEV